MNAQKEHHLDIKFVSTLGLGLFHHHFSFVVKFSFMPVSTVGRGEAVQLLDMLQPEEQSMRGEFYAFASLPYSGVF